MKKVKIITAIIFSIAIIGGIWIAGYYLNKAKGQVKTVSVVGMAERDFDSDLIVWDISFDVLNMNIKDGYASLKEMTKTVKEYLVNQGVAEIEMDFKAVTNYKETEYQYDNQTNRSYSVFKGYRLTQRIRIESNDVEKIEKIQRQISELLDRGINVEENDMSYYYTKLSDLKVEMLAEATENARNRAETIAKSAGAHLGGLKTANMGVFQITAPNSTDEDYSWGGTFNTSSKKKRASINMRLTYNVR